MRTRSAPNIDEQIDDLNDLSRSSRSLQLEQTSLTKKVLTASLQEQWEMFKAKFVTTWVNNQPTDVQLRAAVALANGENTFLLSATGSGKSRVSELFFLMFPKVKKAVIMVLNPLDALGDNQVCLGFRSLSSMSF
jgi:superfamily II helicase